MEKLTSLCLGLALAATGLFGCSPSQPSASAPPPAQGANAQGSTAQAPLAPRPLQPLAGLPDGSPTTPGPVTTARPRPVNPALKVVDLSVSGDPTRLVYPSASLTPGTLYPVVIFAHGHGMDQNQLTDRTELAEAATREGWLAAAGAFSGRAHWANDKALQAVGTLIGELVAHHQADPKRIYLVGFSMGGGTALLAATNPLNLPYRIAAVASSQGFSNLDAMTQAEAGGGGYARSIADAYGGRPDAAMLAAHSAQTHAEKLRGIPVYLEHGEGDVSVPVRHTREMAAKLTALGIAVEVKTYPGLGHDEDNINEENIIGFLRGKSAP